MIDNREIFDLLSVSELRLMLSTDPTWQLPAGCTDARRRMAKARRREVGSVPGEWYVPPNPKREAERLSKQRDRMRYRRARHRRDAA